MAIASDDSFSGWTKTFTDARLCAAIVDRLTFGGNIIETGTDSYRGWPTPKRNKRPAETTYPGTRDRFPLQPNIISLHVSAGGWGHPTLLGFQ